MRGENKRRHSDGVKMKFSFCISMHHSIIILQRGSEDPFIPTLLFFSFFSTPFFLRLHHGSARHSECTQSSLLPKTHLLSNTHSPRLQVHRYSARLQQTARLKHDKEGP
ncbi:Hypothetical predicted protein [Xyrichtys novacula]|uniref:Uncharacterized protein n=1 Tax=Xyrichtys novacula TaxID=13765 RepID=A0AAV1HGM6_XYRNO|nr:Hypothetical predicted protein [Xyrichtys novacula]